MNDRSRSAYAVVLGGLILCSLAVAQQSQPVKTPSQAADLHSRMELSTRQWDFGTVWQGKELKIDVTVTNVGKAPLTTEIKSSCGCTPVSKPKTPLMPGESDTLTIKYNSQTKMGDVKQSVTILSNDPHQERAVVTVRGHVKPSLEQSPRSGLLFGKLRESSREKRTVSIVNKYTEKMSLKIKEGQDFGVFEIALREIEPGQRYELVATTKPPLGVGPIQIQVVLLTGHDRPKELTVQAYGFVPLPVRVAPAKLFLPRNSVMDMTRVITVSHSPDHPIKIIGVRATLDTIKVELKETLSSTDSRDGTREYRIFVTLPPGDRIPAGAEPQIEILTDSKDPDLQKLTVPIRIIEPAAGRTSKSGS